MQAAQPAALATVVAFFLISPFAHATLPVLTDAFIACEGPERVETLPDDGARISNMVSTARSDGQVVFVAAATGTVQGVEERRWMVSAVDPADGTIHWTTVASEGREFRLLGGIALHAGAGTVVVSGTQRGESGPAQGLVVALDARTGEIQWSRTYPQANAGSVHGGMITASANDSRFFAAWTAIRADGGSEVRALDATTGDVAWSTKVSRVDSARAIAATTDGERLVVIGGDGTAPIVALDARTGAVLWETAYDGPGDYDSAGDLILSSDGNQAFVAVTTRDTTVNQVVVAFDLAAGERRWATRVDFLNEAANAIALGPDGRHVYVTGITGPVTESGGYDFLTSAMDAETGAITWTTRQGLPFLDDGPTSLAISKDGRTLYAAGSAAGATSLEREFIVTALDAASGAARDCGRYASPQVGGDHAFTVHVAPDDSRVMSAGITDRTSRGDVTLAYFPAMNPRS